VIDMLKAAFVQGRLSKDEFDLRVSQAFGSQTWAELDALTRDIPALAGVAPAPGRCHRPGRVIPVFVTAIASIGLVLLALLTAPSQPTRRLSSWPARLLPARLTGPRLTIAPAARRVQCGKPWQQPRARPPAGFVAAAAVECVPAPRSLAHRHGRPVFTKRVADHGLAPLVAALRSPPGQHTPGIMCPLPTPMPVLFLFGRDGQIIRPVIPDGCQIPLQQFLAALHSVPWVTVRAPTRR
jgi:hypothetical protein